MFVAGERIAYLSRLASENKELRFKDLYRLVHKVEFLEFAYSTIEGNKGSKTAGIDSVTREELKDPVKRNEVISKLATQLYYRTYQPQPVRRTEIPKSNGKMRKLGIPTLYDRIVQAALKLILQAIYEPIFLPNSHGFRPKHSCQTAINDVVNRTFDWVVEGDIKACFDEIRHGKLLNLLRKRIADENFVSLIGKFLSSGYQMGFGTDGKLPIFVTSKGTPQGGIVSPILANIYLHEFDSFMSKKLKNSESKKAYKVNKYFSMLNNQVARISKKIKEDKWPYRCLSPEPENMGTKNFITLNNRDEAIQQLRKVKSLKTKQPRVDKEELYDNPLYKSLGYVRYADDFVILMGKYSKSDAIEIKDEITKWFGDNLGLMLSPEKTLITHSTEGFQFLGYFVKHMKSENGYGFGRSFAQLYTPDNKKKAFLEKIDKAIRDNHNSPPYDMFVVLNRIIGGWSRYHQIENNWKTTANKMDHYVYWKVLHWMARKDKTSISKILRRHSRRSTIHNNNKRLMVTIENTKTVILEKCYDYEYVIPKTVSDKVKGLTTEEDWMVTDQGNYDSIAGRLRSGSSITEYLELVAQNGEKCELCGSSRDLEIHHLRKVNRTKRKSRTAVEQSAKDIKKSLICIGCHKKETTKQRAK